MAPVDPHEDGGTLSRLRAVPGLVRAWPARHGSLSIEYRDRDGRLRAGQLTAHGGLLLLPYATDPALPALSPRTPGTLVVHRYGRRAVTIGADRVRKAVRPGRGAALAAPAGAAAFAATGLRTARVLAAGEDHVDLELLPGRSLGRLGDAGLEGWQRLSRSWARLARVEANLPVHGPSQEACVLRRWWDRAVEHDVLAGVLAQGAGSQRGGRQLERHLGKEVEATCQALEQGTGTMVVTHRDLHDGQLLWDGTDLSLLDLDTPALAEPALDLGNLMAHVELMTVQRRLSLPGLQQVSDLLDELARSLPTTTSRLRTYRHAAALRLVLVHAFRPAAHTWLPAWVERRLDDGLSSHQSHATEWSRP